MEEGDPAMNPDLDLDVSFSTTLSSRFQDQVLRFSMPPPDDNAYDDETVSDFLGQVPLYYEFRRRMRLLIIQNPDYAHLRDLWNFLYRGFIGEEQVDDNFLFLYPAVMFVLHESFLLTGETRRKRILAAQLQWSRTRRRNRRQVDADADETAGRRRRRRNHRRRRRRNHRRCRNRRRRRRRNHRRSRNRRRRRKQAGGLEAIGTLW